MDENDRHIFDQIRESKVTKVFVSIYGNENDENNKKSKQMLSDFCQKKDVVLIFL